MIAQVLAAPAFEAQVTSVTAKRSIWPVTNQR